MRSCSGLKARTAAAVRVFCATTFVNKKMHCVSNHAVHLPETIQQENCLNGFWKVLFKSTTTYSLVSLLLLITLLAVPADVLAVPAGTSIDNNATAAFDFSGTPGGGATSNIVSVVTTVLRTPSIVSFWQYDPTATSTFTPTVVTQHATSGPPGSGFIVSPDPVVPVIGGGSVVLTATDPQPLNPVDVLSTGGPVFVRLEDQDQNTDSTVRETIRVIVTSSTGDEEGLILTETGPDTGVFVGYVQTSSNAVAQYDGDLILGEDTTIFVQYTDAFDPTDVSTAATLVDPFGVVFSSIDGTLLDGAIVTIFDSAGNPAAVFGDDGVSTYSSSVITGGTVTDSGGTVYNLPAGAYRFPRLLPGDYRMVVTPPAGYTSPSTVAMSDVQALPTAPYALDASASYEGVFTLVPGPPLHVDIPLDILTSYLVIDKKASKDTAAIGDFVQYTLTLNNTATNAAANNIVISDTLPIGLRYQSASVRYDGVSGAEPQISSDGRTLTFTIATLLPSSLVQVRYVTELTVATKLGKAVNSVTAQDSLGTQSNVAQAAITVTEDLFASNSFIAGRVIVGECNEDSTLINPGLPSVRVFMEDGTYAATDEQGRFHFEGVKPGTHVVQVDTESIPDNLEIVECVKNTRFADTPYSQFVDVQGGTLWRTDFYVREKQPITDIATLVIKSELSEEDIKYTIEMTNGEIPVTNYRLMITLPDGIEYKKDSSMLDLTIVNDPYINDNILVYRLGDLGSNWKRKLKFRGHIKEQAEGELVTTTLSTMDTAMKKGIRLTPVKNKLQISRERKEDKKTIFKAYFAPLSTELSHMSKKQLRQSIESLGEAEIKRSDITGFADAVTVASRSTWLFKDNNVLSTARAEVVKDFLINELYINEETVFVNGYGSTKPVGDDDTIEGRSLNRRAELVVTTNEIVSKGNVDLVTAESEVSEVEIKGQPEFKVEKIIEAPPATGQKDISNFDDFWIKDAEPGYEWLTPDANFLPVSPSVNLAIKHKPSDKYEILLNGETLNPLFYFGKISNKENTVARSHWQGVHLNKGVNRIDFIVKDKSGNIVKQMTREVVFAGAPVRAELAEEYSRLIADGRNMPIVAIRVYDKDGNFARPGSRGKFTLSEPYIAKKEVEAYQHNRLSGLNNEEPEYIVGKNGIAYISLESTTNTGKLEIDLPFSGRKDSRLQTWIQPEVRDWIMVGLAEGMIGYNRVSGNTEALDASDNEDKFYQEGKIAFYAKGKVKSDWLLTTSYDTSKDTGNRVDQLIDPDTYYTIYGDNSDQRHDASSAEKLYVKIERQHFYAMFGDIDTGLSVTELSKFNRRMTGVKSEYDDGRFAYAVFAAENINNYIKDEIQGEGISGLYRLSGKNIVINSDQITIETRDRFRNEIIVKTETMHRHLDYSVDYSDGTIFFRRPIQSRDENFNPVFIVADYEVEAPVEGDITAGGRASVQLNDGKVELGGTLVHDASYLNEGDLIGADVRIEIDNKTVVRLEAATTDVTSSAQDFSGSAYSAEIEHGGDDLRARVYAQQQDADFGLGQQSAGQSGTRKYGAEGNYRVTKKVAVDGAVYHEDNLNSDAERDVAEAGVTYNEYGYSLSAGARIARDTDSQGIANDSNLLLLGGSKGFFDGLIKLRAAAEIAVDSANENVDHPSRYILGADYFITSRVNLFAENEWTDGRDQDTQMTRAGVRATPWKNAQINTAINQETNENGIRSFATLGLTQSFPISKHWAGDVAFDRAKTIRTPSATPFNPEVPVAQGTADNDFTAVSLGTTYTEKTYTINNRVEWREAEQEDKYGVIVNWERSLQQGIGYSASTKVFSTDRADGSELLDGDVRFSMVYRPLQSRWIALNRLDFVFDSQTDIIGIKTRQRKLIENLTTNYLINDRNQVAFNFGLKYVVDNFDTAEYSGITGLLGGEYRHDINDNFDVGVHANGHYSKNSSVLQYSTGVSVGWNMARNVWLSVGYNFDGFEDRDFSAAGYTAQGPYIRFRLKFDQDTAETIQNWLN